MKYCLCEARLFSCVQIFNLMGQNVNLAQQVAVQNVCCVFYYFCGGHKNCFLLWFPSPFIINLESLDSYNITNFCSLLVKMVWLLNSFIVWSVSSSVFQNNVNSELHKNNPSAVKTKTIIQNRFEEIPDKS